MKNNDKQPDPTVKQFTFTLGPDDVALEVHIRLETRTESIYNSKHYCPGIST